MAYKKLALVRVPRFTLSAVPYLSSYFKKKSNHVIVITFAKQACRHYVRIMPQNKLTGARIIFVLNLLHKTLALFPNILCCAKRKSLIFWKKCITL